MKRSKTFAILLIVLSFVFCLSGCNLGSYIQNGTDKPPAGTTDPSEPDNPDTPKPDDPTASHYTLTVFFDNKPFTPGDTDVVAVWRNGNAVTRVKLGADGKADAGELDGDFNVYLTGLPQEYVYNPNGYKATSDARNVSILLTSVTEPQSGDGSNMYGNKGCYFTRKEGNYRAEIKRENGVLYYEYQPMDSGRYVVESWVNIYDDEVNPLLHLYAGNSQNKWFERTLDGGGAASDGGFTKNFRYEFAVDLSGVGASWTFAVGASSKAQSYPVTVDFEIKKIGEYTSDYEDERPQAAKEAKSMTPEPKAGETFVFADMGTKVFDAKKFKKSPNTGFYHLYDAEKYADNPYGTYGKGYGPMLMCAINKKIPSYTVVTSLYTANKVGVNGANYLKLFNVWIEEEEKYAIYDYTNFIRIDYYRICNSDGVCYVTDELIAFLQIFAENHTLYTDGVGPGAGTPEAMGYTANQDSLWLFACGFYE